MGILTIIIHTNIFMIHICNNIVLMRYNLITKKTLKLENLDYKDKIGLNWKRNSDPGLETGYKTQKKYGVYSCPSLHIF